MSDDTPPPLRPRFRITLWQLFVYSALITVIFSHVVASRRLVLLQRELRQMRRTFGYPDVVERGRVTAGMVDTGIAGVWRFRVFKPAHTTLVVRAASTGIDSGRLPRHEQEFRIDLPHDEEGEIFVDVAVKERYRKYELVVVCDPRGKTASLHIELPPEHPLVQHKYWEERPPGPPLETYGLQEWNNQESRRTFDGSNATEPYALLVYASGTEADLKPDGRLPGAAVWLEEVPP